MNRFWPNNFYANRYFVIDLIFLLPLTGLRTVKLSRQTEKISACGKGGCHWCCVWAFRDEGIGMEWLSGGEEGG